MALWHGFKEHSVVGFFFTDESCFVMKADFLYNIFMLYFHLYKSIIIHKTVIGMLYFPSGLLDIFQAQQSEQ